LSDKNREYDGRRRSADGRRYVKFFSENERKRKHMPYIYDISMQESDVITIDTYADANARRACIYTYLYKATPCYEISQEQEKATRTDRSILLHRWRRSDVLVLAVCSSVVLRVSSGKQPSAASSIFSPSAPWRRPPTDT
jgi:hypothetical protein